MMELILISGTVVAFYALLANRLFAFARPLREDAYDLAFDIHADERFSPAKRAQALRMANGTTSTLVAWILVFVVIGTLVEDSAKWCLGGKHRSHSGLPDGVPVDGTQSWNVLVRATIISSLCTSPAALVLFGALMGAASFVRSGAELADSVMKKASYAGAGKNDDLCPPAQPV